MESLKCFYYSAIKRESFFSFILKGIAGVLPSNENMKKWKITNNEKCYVFEQIESSQHILCECRKERIVKIVANTFTRIKFDPSPDKLIVRGMIDNICNEWSYCNAFGILGIYTIEYLKTNNINENIIIEISRKLTTIGKLIWDKHFMEKRTFISNVIKTGNHENTGCLSNGTSSTSSILSVDVGF